jgi:hypothetical protein
MLVAGAAPVGDALAAQKCDVALHTARHRAPGELPHRIQKANLGVSIIHPVADQFFSGKYVQSLPLTGMSLFFNQFRNGSS